MAGPHELKGRLQDQLGLLIGHCQYMEWKYEALRQRYAGIPFGVKSNKKIFHQERAYCEVELGLKSQTTTRSQLLQLSRICQNIEDALSAWRVPRATELLMMAEEIVQKLYVFLPLLQTALEAHEQYWQGMMKSTQSLSTLSNQMERYRAEYVQLQDRSRKLPPSTGSTLQVDRAARKTRQASLDSELQDTIAHFDDAVAKGKEALANFDLSGINDAADIAEFWLYEVQVYIGNVQRAVEAHDEAPRAHKRVKKHDSALSVDLTTFPSPYAEQQSLQGTPVLHHPRPISVSPRRAVEKWIQQLPDDYSDDEVDIVL